MLTKDREEDMAKLRIKFEEEFMTQNDILNSIEEQLEDARKEAIAVGLAEGREEGRAEGRAEANADVAKKLLEMQMDIRSIAEVTGLSIEAIKAL